MRTPQSAGWTRRRVLGGLTVAGTAGLLGLPARPVAAEPPPETTTLRILQGRSICTSPQYVAEALLRGEGFTAVHYVETGQGTLAQLLASGEVHLTFLEGASLLPMIDAGDPVVILSGVHVGCYELFGTDRVRSIRDLKGKTIARPSAITDTAASPNFLLAGILAYVGLDPRKDVTWVTYPLAEAMQLLAAGQIDAFWAFPPEPQELRARGIGHVVVNTRTDRPWSQYFCCMVGANRTFVQQHPMATKRALRAILKAVDLCAREPERVARDIVDKEWARFEGALYEKQYAYARQVMQELPYNTWREYDPEDTVRFYALRLHEAGMLKHSPQKIIAQGTDWRFLNELKRELKG
jgi:NitT/TauT family transport system substrate-binding protein